VDAVQSIPPVGVRLASLWVIVAFSNLPLYIFMFVVPALVPLYWFAALLALTLITLWRAAASERDRAPVFLATLACYACICLAWYVAQGGGESVLLRQRVLNIVLCGASYLVFAANPSALHAARRTLVFTVLMSVAVNAWDITHPFMLVPAYSELSTAGRAAGFFINANQAGGALVAGFTLSVSVVPSRWRSAYLALVAIGVALTFSRAAILGLALVSVALVYRGRSLSLRQVAAAAVTIAGVTWITWIFISAELQDRFHVDPDVALDRLLWILDPSGRSDYSEWERLAMLEQGWEQFLASPFVGHGVGSTELWDARATTHNMYVTLASDFGVIGLFVLPAIVLAAIGMWRGLTDAVVTGLFLLFWGFFSHNVFYDSYLAISLMAALSRREPVAVSDGERGAHRALAA
jgi:O-antigen ligase